MADSSNDYDQFPDHPLCGIDKSILEVARGALREAEADGAVEKDMAEPLADFVVQRLREANMLRES